ncbi:MAG: efflux transporter outer membrane subunit [Deltaproteobacteria bacterium]|nr:efflux transporter outer membrane subunit [Deltaproteobacteria bacterium]
MHFIKILKFLLYFKRGFQIKNIKRTYVYLFIVTAFFHTACTVGPHYKKPTIKIPSRWSNETPFTGKDAKKLSKWWTLFEDETLSYLINLAVSSNADIKKTILNLKKARLRHQISVSAKLPSVSSGAAAAATTTNLKNYSQKTELSIDASWEIDLFGGLKHQSQATAADYMTNFYNLFSAKVSLSSEIALLYIEIRTLQNRIISMNKNINLLSETIKLAKMREKAGVSSSGDVEVAIANRENSLAQLPQLRETLNNTILSLELLLEKQPGALKRLLTENAQLPSVPKKISMGIPADIIRQRPDIIAAESKLIAENARIGVSKAALYPALALSGGATMDMLASGTGFSGNILASLAASITAPLLNRTRLKNQVKIQIHEYEEARISYKHTVLTALSEVETALVSLKFIRHRILSLKNSMKAFEKALSLVRQSYTAGLTDIVSIVDIERTIITAQDTLLSSRGDELKAIIRLFKALGGGWDVEKYGTGKRKK